MTKNLKTILSLAFIAISINLNAQVKNCPDSNQVISFAKIMDLQFAKDFENCKIKTEAIFLGTGNAGYAVPGQFKKLVIFRAYPPEQEPIKHSINGTALGNFLFIDKTQSDIIFSLKTGDLITLKGEVIVSVKMGYKQTNFVVSEVVLKK